jgi:hypothetical protein
MSDGQNVDEWSNGKRYTMSMNTIRNTYATLVRQLKRWAGYGAVAAVATLMVVLGASNAGATNADQPRGSESPAASTDNSPRQANWISEIRNAVAIQKQSNPESNFGPYLKSLNAADEGLARGDKQTVRKEMSSFFQMLSKHKGINEGSATELTNFAQMVAPVQEFGIAIPRSTADEYSTTVVQ